MARVGQRVRDDVGDWDMTIHVGWKIAGAAALGIGAMALLGACASTRKPGGGEPQDELSSLANALMRQAHPSHRNGGSLDVATQAVQQVRGEGGRLVGAYDGTRLLRAADEHRFGAPVNADPSVDVANDGTATFVEVREVLRHFDADGSNSFQRDELRAFESAVGVEWKPA